MGYDRDSHVQSFITGLLLGAAIGAAAALLAAPDSGRRTRRRIRKVAGEARETATDRWDELATDVKEKVDDAVKVARKKFTT